MTELAHELRALALLLQQGNPLGEALEKLAARSVRVELWKSCAASVRSGGGIGGPLRSGGMPSGLAAFVDQAGEGLTEALRLSATLLLDQSRRRSVWRSLLIYPALLFAGFLLDVTLVSYVVQEYAGIFAAAADLPPATRLLLQASAWWVHSSPLVFLLPLALGAVLSRPAVRVRLPIVGWDMRRREAAAFFRWLEPMLATGTPLPEAVEAAAASGEVAPYRRGWVRAAQEMRRGATFAEASRCVCLLPPLACWLLGQAEERQFRPGVLSWSADVLEKELEFGAAQVTTLLQLSFVLSFGLLVLAVLLNLLPLLTTATV